MQSNEALHNASLFDDYLESYEEQEKYKGYTNVRCISCDCNLSDEESTRKSSVTGEYLDLCNGCLDTIEILQYTAKKDEFVEVIEQEELDLDVLFPPKEEIENA